MAKQSGERRLLFDTQGKRRNVIKVVYATLALLMGTSLFLVVGPFNLGELVGNSGGSTAAKVLDEQAERIETRLARDPSNEELLLALTRARINAGNAQIEVVAEGEVPTVPPEANEDFEAASQVWSLYLKQADEPSPTVAQLVAGTFFRLGESSSSQLEAQERIAKATQAQQIAAEQRPNIGSLSTLAIYEYFNGEFAAGDKTMKQAAAKAPSKAEAPAIEEQLAEYRKNAKAFDRQRQQLAKVQQKFNKEQLQNPLGSGLGAGAGSVGE
jgi:hypothetical protein